VRPKSSLRTAIVHDEGVDLKKRSRLDGFEVALAKTQVAATVLVGAVFIVADGAFARMLPVCGLPSSSWLSSCSRMAEHWHHAMGL